MKVESIATDMNPNRSEFYYGSKRTEWYVGVGILMLAPLPWQQLWLCGDSTAVPPLVVD
jgi:hypothetical protein